jgi:hypothetical protein
MPAFQSCFCKEKFMKSLYRFVCIFVIVFSLLATSGCDKVKKAINATARLAAQVNSLQAQVEKSYDERLIDRATALKLTRLIKDELNPAVGAYTDFVEKLSRAYPTGTKPKSADWATVRALFQAVEDSFQKVLVTVGALTPEKSALISLAIDTLVEIIDLIRGAVAEADAYFLPEVRYA